MSKSSTISARIDPNTKKGAERVFEKLGLTASQAISLFYKQVQLRQGLPFEVKVPNERTRRALKDAQKRQNLQGYDSVDELLEDVTQ